EGSRGDGREAYAAAVQPVGFLHAMAIAALQDLWLVALAALPDRTHCVDHISDFQIAAGSAHRLSRRQRPAKVAYTAALRKQLRPGCAMDGSIHASAAQQRRVGC